MGVSDVIVVVARIQPGVDPPYRPHARATCCSCPEWVWLGSDSLHLVQDHGVLPMCEECAIRHNVGPQQQVGHIHDERPGA